MPMLSEKAKGKQRAESSEGLDPAASTSQAAPAQREIAVRFTEGVEDLTVYVGENDSVKDLKAKIRSQRTEVKNRRLRLIHSGRLLTNGTLLYPWLNSLEERHRRTQSKDEAVQGEGSSNEPDITWLHCSVGPVMDIGETDEIDTVQAAQIRPLRGFDRLQAAGFSEEEIASIRRQFHNESVNQNADPDMSVEELDEHVRNLEEQWIDSIDNFGSAALSQSSSSSPSTLLQGLLLGFFFPVIPFFLFREPHIPVFWEDGRQTEQLPSVIFSRRMQMFIIVGFLLNILFGLWR
ncbi:hypothetical protein M422DRAFT_101876, partial [Sphaerobolus stellatus SS14]